MEKGNKKEKSIALIADSSEKYDEVKTKFTKATRNRSVCEGKSEATKRKKMEEEDDEHTSIF